HRGGGAGGRVRPPAPGRDPPPLAVPARSPHRRLRADRPPPARRVNAGRDTPPARGYRMPAEWEPHAATWLAWPHARGDWPGRLEPIPWVYVEVVRHLVTGERVHILVNDARTARDARARLRRGGVDLRRVDFYRVPTDRSWTRDYCPIFVRRARGPT